MLVLVSYATTVSLVFWVYGSNHIISLCSLSLSLSLSHSPILFLSVNSRPSAKLRNELAQRFDTTQGETQATMRKTMNNKKSICTFNEKANFGPRGSWKKWDTSKLIFPSLSPSSFLSEPGPDWSRNTQKTSDQEYERHKELPSRVRLDHAYKRIKTWGNIIFPSSLFPLPQSKPSFHSKVASRMMRAHASQRN